jgi:hypothetical protein
LKKRCFLGRGKLLFTGKEILGNRAYKKVGIAFIADDKSNSAESFWKMGCGGR